MELKIGSDCEDDASLEPALSPQEAQSLRHAESSNTLHSLAKDMHSVTAHAQALRQQAQHVLEATRATRAHAIQPSPKDTCLTVPEACLALGICERTLRTALREPVLAARLETGSRKAGTFYKTIRLLPPDLVADLMPRFAKKKNPNSTPA